MPLGGHSPDIKEGPTTLSFYMQLFHIFILPICFLEIVKFWISGLDSYFNIFPAQTFYESDKIELNVDIDN